MSDHFDGAQQALDRMKRAYERGTGCRLTADMIGSLAVSMIGQMWSEKAPNHPTSREGGDQ